ncbi:uncharacterized protein B0I36DRAFT_437158 [Microdochium trichocladiopsis]|uniref:P-loop containing nucleoside triphosphate hydrolase protein n=1 Tax=Microdochium trichocladiopsis TaxID=1682393 RepID=A0A9P8XP62_9PEZI|nr:uncharacterized protein B0I36DRAFT_437158 [Microdochium trichocladiopsis]KAH7007847.1 hypothetical protein B0I36DRAFT_437158 [Microdochium trichocladiopsis]
MVRAASFPSCEKPCNRLPRTTTRTFSQELIAPQIVEFYSKEGIFLGDKRSLEVVIRDVTGIPTRALRDTPLSDFTTSEREAWIRNRETKYEEDMVYSLLGIFGVYMQLIYGEGREQARRRLREEVQKSVKGTHYNKFSISFSLSGVPETPHFVARDGEVAEMRRMLCSDGSRRIVVLHGLGGIGKTQLAATLKGLNLQQDHDEIIQAVKAWLSLLDLVRELDGLPLALATAGAYLKRAPISIPKYLRYYKESWARLTGNLHLGSYADRTLATTWQLSYEHVQTQNPLAAHLLQWWAYFNNEDIWYDLIQASNEDGPMWMKQLSGELNFNDAMGVLYDYSLVEPTTIFQEIQGVVLVTQVPRLSPTTALAY